MNRSEFEDFCSNEDHPYFSLSKVISTNTDSVRLPRWLTTNVDTVGIFGNADPLDQNQWVIIQSSIHSPNNVSVDKKWLSSESECLGLASELYYKIWWTFVGPTDRPQAKILRCV